MHLLCLLGLLIAPAIAKSDGSLLPDALGRRSRLATPPALGPDCDTATLWVFFTDKQIADESALNTAWEQLPTDGRRAAADVRDLPVPAQYVAAVAACGARIRHVTRWFNAASVRATPAQVALLTRLECVAGVRPVASGRRAGPPRAIATAKAAAVSEYPRDYGLSLLQLLPLQVPELHALGLSGSGVVISLLDSGFRLVHRAFDSLLNAGRVAERWDFVKGDTSVANDTSDVPGQDYHGTEVLSTMAALAHGELVGASPLATYLLAKTEDLGSETPLEEDHYVAALEWADSLGARVVSSSLAYDFGYTMDGTEGISTLAANTAAARGILLVTAMGNSGPLPTTLGAPADAFGIVSVGAVDVSGVIAPFSSRGPTADGRTKPEVVAQGVSVHAADPANPDTYVAVSGTSFATPITAASAALLCEAHPDWTPLQVREALMQSGDRAGMPDNAYGWGRFNLLAALDYEPAGALALHPVIDDAHDAGAWRLRVIAFAEAGRRPVQMWALYETTPGDEDSLELAPQDDTLWEAMLPSGGESQLTWRVRALDESGRAVAYPPDPHRRLELRRQPDALVEDFETGGLRWLRGGTHPLFWPSAAAAFEGRFALSDSPGRGYPDGCDAWTMTRVPLVAGSDLPWQLSFQTRYQFAAGDSGLVEWRSSSDTTWQPLAAFTGTQSTWTEKTAAVSTLSGDSVWLRFRLRSDAAITGDGWYVDRVRMGGTTAAVSEDPAGVRPRAWLEAPAPNPFNRATRLGIRLDRPAQVRLLVYDVLGRRVRVLWSGALGAGSRAFDWDARDDRGKALASGVYLALLQVDELAFTRKLMLLK